MKTLCFLLTAGCLAFSSAHADMAYPRAPQKSESESSYLNSFWYKAQINQAFIDALTEAAPILVIGQSSRETRKIGLDTLGDASGSSTSPSLSTSISTTASAASSPSAALGQ